jgi:uncharacterized membrane protein YkoI
MKYLFFIVMALSLSVALQAADNPQQFETCLEAALKERPGQVVKVESKIEEDQAVYEFDIRGLDGLDWDIECHAQRGVIVEVEREVDQANHPLFKSKVKINEQQARQIALDLYPGEIIEVEYEIEANGQASYEFDIDTVTGDEMKIEVDATSGEIVEISRELWQIGLE